MNLTKEKEIELKESTIEYLHQIGIEVENINDVEIISINVHSLNYISGTKFKYKNYIITNDGNNWRLSSD